MCRRIATILCFDGADNRVLFADADIKRCKKQKRGVCRWLLVRFRIFLFRAFVDRKRRVGRAGADRLAFPDYFAVVRWIFRVVCRVSGNVYMVCKVNLAQNICVCGNVDGF